jgi:hypothetical protein
MPPLTDLYAAMLAEANIRIPRFNWKPISARKPDVLVSLMETGLV